jgi:hypothetical protein
LHRPIKDAFTTQNGLGDDMQVRKTSTRWKGSTSNPLRKKNIPVYLPLLASLVEPRHLALREWRVAGGRATIVTIVSFNDHHVRGAN